MNRRIRPPKKVCSVFKILINISSLNVVWSDNYTMSIIIQSRTRKVDKDLARELDSNTIKLPITITDNHKKEKKNCISISLFGYKD